MEKRRNEREWKEKRPSGRNGEERKGRKPFHTAREEREMDREINENQLEGRNAILEVLRSGRDIEKIMVAKGNVEGTIKRIIAMAVEKGVVIQEVSRQKLDEISQTKNHQGVIALVSAHDYVEVEDILAAAKEKGEDPFVLLLDGITDPHNLGAILRTAECAGVHGVIIPKRRSVGLNATVGKTSAGAIEYMPVARVTNIVQTMEYLKKEGFSPLHIRKLPEAKHIFSHVEWDMVGYLVQVDELEKSCREELVFIQPRTAQEEYAIPSAFEKYAGYLQIRLGNERYRE